MRHHRGLALFAAVGVLAGFASCSSDEADTAISEVATAISEVVTSDSTGTESSVPDSSVPESSQDTDPTSATAAETTEASTGTTESSDSSESTDTSDLEIDDRIDQAAEALAAGDFSTMLDLLELSGLSDEIEGREITILAPTEEAFSSLDSDEISDLLSNPTEVEDILRRHILDQLYTYEELSAQTEVTTLSGETLDVVADGGAVTIGGAQVTVPDAEALTGDQGQEIAVFGIDTVLLEGQ